MESRWKWSPRLPHRWTLLPLRLVIGLGFLLHGLAKWNRGPAKFTALLQHIGTPYPVATAWMVTGLEIVGGAMLIVGLLVALLSIPLAISMLVAMFTIHVHYGFSAVNTHRPDAGRACVRTAWI